MIPVWMGDLIRFPLERRQRSTYEARVKDRPFFGLRLRPDAPAVYVTEDAEGNTLTWTITAGAEFITDIVGGSRRD